MSRHGGREYRSAAILRRCLPLLACCGLLALHGSRAADSAQITAAETAATGSAACKAIGDFYWEIGDRDRTLASGQIGTDVSATTSIKIASASKWVFGAYVLEKLGSRVKPSHHQVEALEMRSGYTDFNPFNCLLSRTVEGCFDAGNNSGQKSGDIGRFSYGGGHSQKLAIELGLGRDNDDELTREVFGYVGTGTGLRYGHPQLAGGLEGPPAGYAAFLRRIVAGQLRMQKYLGYEPVCTLPASCPSATSSPVPEAWHYSLDHWIEDAPGGDGAYSSPGLLGFYPWISADKSTYGLVARERLSKTAAWDSVQCGREIRRAWNQGAAGR